MLAGRVMIPPTTDGAAHRIELWVNIKAMAYFLWISQTGTMGILV